MTVRMTTCRSLATNREELARFKDLLWGIEKSATPVKLLLPWFPGKARKENDRCTKELFGLLYGHIEGRKAAPEGLGSEAIDILLTQGLQTSDIIQVL